MKWKKDIKTMVFRSLKLHKNFFLETLEKVHFFLIFLTYFPHLLRTNFFEPLVVRKEQV